MNELVRQIETTLGDFTDQFQVEDMARYLLDQGVTDIDTLDRDEYNAVLARFEI